MTRWLPLLSLLVACEPPAPPPPGAYDFGGDVIVTVNGEGVHQGLLLNHEIVMTGHRQPVPAGGQQPGCKPPSGCPDITRARDVLGWQPTTDLETGLARALKYFRDIADLSVDTATG